MNAFAHFASFAAAGLVALGSIACSSGYEGASESVASADLPPLDAFYPVAIVLDYSCGNLDCHGAQGRNLKLYGPDGRRLDPGDVACGSPITAAEQRADYGSIIALEPELIAEVVASHGAKAGELTIVRKARGAEAHKGGVVFPKGSTGDQCLVNWLGGSTDPSACDNQVVADNRYTVCQ